MTPGTVQCVPATTGSAAKRRVAEIGGLRAKVQGLEAGIAGHQGEANRLAAAHPRVLGSDDRAAFPTAKADKPAGGFSGRTIRSTDLPEVELPQ